MEWRRNAAIKSRSVCRWFFLIKKKKLFRYRWVGLDSAGLHGFRLAKNVRIDVLEALPAVHLMPPKNKDDRLCWKRNRMAGVTPVFYFIFLPKSWTAPSRHRRTPETHENGSGFFFTEKYVITGSQIALLILVSLLLSTSSATKMFASVKSAFFPRIVCSSQPHRKRCFSVLKVSQSKLVMHGSETT